MIYLKISSRSRGLLPTKWFDFPCRIFYLESGSRYIYAENVLKFVKVINCKFEYYSALHHVYPKFEKSLIESLWGLTHNDSLAVTHANLMLLLPPPVENNI